MCKIVENTIKQFKQMENQVEDSQEMNLVKKNERKMANQSSV